MDIELKNIFQTFESKKVIEDLSWKFESGNFYLIKGPSGCGKSTMLRLLAKLTPPVSGEISYGTDVPITELRRKVHYLTQMPLMFEGTVAENLLKPFSFPPHQELAPSLERCNEMLTTLFPEGVDLQDDAQKLSQGQKQRVALCRTLLINPDVLLCDEPSASLDMNSRKIVDKAIQNFFQSSPDKLVIYISHHEEIYVDNSYKVLEMNGKSLEEL